MPNWQKLAAAGASAVIVAVAMGGTFEGRRLIAYMDGANTWTICDGHTQGVYPGMTATPAQCKAWLTQEMQEAVTGIQRCLKRRPTDNQLAAFGDLAYNVGVPTFCRSSIARKFNQGNERDACDAILLYDKAGGKVLQGLVKRRQAERALCLSR